VPRTYDAALRRRVVELVRAGRPVRVVAAELELAEATVYRWKAQDLVDRGVKPGISTSEHLDQRARRAGRGQTAHQRVGDRTRLGQGGREAV
jgi:transposase